MMRCGGVDEQRLQASMDPRQNGLLSGVRAIGRETRPHIGGQHAGGEPVINGCALQERRSVRALEPGCQAMLAWRGKCGKNCGGCEVRDASIAGMEVFANGGVLKYA